MSAHARLGPSNHRWPHCAGSVREESGYEDTAGAAAIDGTGSHLLLELCLVNEVSAIHYDRTIIGVNHADNRNGWLVDLERCRRVQECLDYITRRTRELRAQFPISSITVEAESISNVGSMYGRDDWWGTCDVTITCANMIGQEVYFLEVIDYKDGRGWVGAKNNSQLQSYLGGQVYHHAFNGTTVSPHLIGGVRMTIVQPKTGQSVRYQCSTVPDDKLTVDSLLRQLDVLGVAAYKTDDPHAPVTSGKHCQWCKANPKRGGHCIASTEKSIKQVTSMSNEIIKSDAPMFEVATKVIADPKTLTSAQLSEFASAKAGLMAAFTACEKEIEDRINKGQQVSGYAMREGNKTNVWALPEEEIIKKLKGRKFTERDIFPRKLVSPAQALKCTKLTAGQKKTLEKDLIAQVAGKMALTKVAHSATDVLQSATDLFEGVGDMPAPISFL